MSSGETVRINEQNIALERAARIVAETEEVGNETVQELGRNREAIESARGKVNLFFIVLKKNFFFFFFSNLGCRNHLYG